MCLVPARNLPASPHRCVLYTERWFREFTGHCNSRACIASGFSDRSWQTTPRTAITYNTAYAGAMRRQKHIRSIGMAIRSHGYEYGHDFLLICGICTRSESRRVRNEYFFSPAGNPMGTRYFTIIIIIGCEQVKMYSFCYINYDLFWLLKFATLLSQIFVEY
jgi:hypothetical protein